MILSIFFTDKFHVEHYQNIFFIIYDFITQKLKNYHWETAPEFTKLLYFDFSFIMKLDFFFFF